MKNQYGWMDGGRGRGWGGVGVGVGGQASKRGRMDFLDYMEGAEQKGKGAIFSQKMWEEATLGDSPILTRSTFHNYKLLYLLSA